MDTSNSSSSREAFLQEVLSELRSPTPSSPPLSIWIPLILFLRGKPFFKRSCRSFGFLLHLTHLFLWIPLILLLRKKPSLNIMLNSKPNLS
uniref:Uncharacterized protein n=1 Tax=Cucumis sativus TaxID=3659 RepID=A0A0A0LKS8_CUCSA